MTASKTRPLELSLSRFEAQLAVVALKDRARFCRSEAHGAFDKQWLSEALVCEKAANDIETRLRDQIKEDQHG